MCTFVENSREIITAKCFFWEATEKIAPLSPANSRQSCTAESSKGAS